MQTWNVFNDYLVICVEFVSDSQMKCRQVGFLANCTLYSLTCSFDISILSMAIEVPAYKAMLALLFNILAFDMAQI